jgi:iron-sulfur cluster repair protein YtfE (RIC family)
MKRHQALAPLSREHHDALILAQLLKNIEIVYKGLPTEVAGKAAYASLFYEEELIKHFYEEEEILIKKITGIDARLDTLADEILAEHKELRILFTAINNAGDISAHLVKTGNALEQHIRKEERIFFPLIQQLCNEEQLAAIEKGLSI